MTKNLIERLRAKPCDNINPPAIELEAANRIEALTGALDDCVKRLNLLIRRERHKLLDVVARDAARAVLNGKDTPAREVEGINLNQHFTVILTESGAQVYNDAYADLIRKYPDAGFKVVKAGDQLRDSLWSLMQVFGPRIVMGMQPHFERNEVVPMPD